MNFLEYKKTKVTFLILCNVLLFYFLNKTIINFLIFSKYIPGWDGSTHFSMAILYSQSIFPAVWGWIPNYFFGMPFPQFYPPLFSYVFSILNIFINNPELIYKTILLVCVFVQPILFCFFYYQITKKINSSIIVLFSTTIFLSIPDYMNSITNSFFAATNVGVVSQIVTSIFFYLFLFFLSRPSNYFNVFMRIILLSIIFLGSIHLAFLSFFAFCFSFIYEIYESKKTETIYTYIFTGLCALGIASFWLLPMVYYFDFSLALPIKPDLFNLSLYQRNQWFILVVLSVFLYTLYRHKNKFLFIISSTSLLVFFFEKKAWFFYGLNFPMHIDRYVAVMIQFIPLCIVYVLFDMGISLKIRKIFLVAFVLFLIFNFSFTQYTIGNRGIIDPTFESFLSDSIQTIHTHVPEGSKQIIEYFTFIDTPMSRVLNDYVGQFLNSQIAVTIFRESSISAIFNVPVRNLISDSKEHWGIRSSLALNERYNSKTIRQKVIDLKMIGIEYLTVKSDKDTSLFKESNDFSFVAQEGALQVFKLKYKDILETPEYKVLKYKPILVVSDIDAKKYNGNRLDFITLSEQALALSNTKLQFVHVKYDEIAKLDLSDFSFVIFDQKLSVDKEIENTIIVNPDTKFFLSNNVSSSIKQKNVRYYVDMQNYSVRESYFKILFTQFERYLIPVRQPKNISFEHEDNIFTISNKTQDPLYILVKYSYFPAWQRITKEPVLLASPSFVYVKINPKSVDSIYFSTPYIVKIGHYIALFSVFILICFVYLGYRISKKIRR